MLRGVRIALVEDDEIMGGSLVQRLELEGASVIWLRQVSRALGALRTPVALIDVVICDIRLPDGTGEELFNELHKTATPPPFLFVTGHGGIEQAVRLMRGGAADYVSKPFEMPVLLDRLVELLANAPREELPVILGVSAAARKIERQASKAAANSRNVLITGGPGTGKGLVARRIHELSDRRAAPFVTVNLAREANATNALLRPDGAFEKTGEGVLYIHALGLLPDDARVGLLQNLMQGFDGRIIASCDKGLGELQAQGEADAELLYRLDMIEIPVPPLAQRPEDAVWLLSRLFPKMNARRGLPLQGVSQLCEQVVRDHDWSGGGRELRARVAHGVSTSLGPLLQPIDLFPERIADASASPSLTEARERAERRHIVEVLEQCDGQMGKAASILKVSRTTLWDKMQKYDLGKSST
jgi:DNA-binding NtrC family response regulator